MSEERTALEGHMDASYAIESEVFAISCPQCGSTQTIWLTGPETPPRVSGYFCGFTCECRRCEATFEVAMSVIDVKLLP